MLKNTWRCVDLDTGECIGDCQGSGDCPICQQFWGNIKEYTSNDMIEWGLKNKKIEEKVEAFYESDEGKKLLKEIVDEFRRKNNEN